MKTKKSHCYLCGEEVLNLKNTDGFKAIKPFVIICLNCIKERKIKK